MSEQVVLWTGPQETALRSLAGGAHVMEAAVEAGVRRETVSRWLAQEDFRAELLRRREEIWASYRDQLTQLTGLALDGLQRLIRGVEYNGEHYDPRIQLDAIALVLRVSGLLPQRAGPGLAVQINNTVGGQNGHEVRYVEADA